MNATCERTSFGTFNKREHEPREAPLASRHRPCQMIHCNQPCRLSTNLSRSSCWICSLSNHARLNQLDQQSQRAVCRIKEGKRCYRSIRLITRTDRHHRAVRPRGAATLCAPDRADKRAAHARHRDHHTRCPNGGKRPAARLARVV